MEVVQVRLPEKLVKKIDELVAQGFYSSRSDFIRTKIRRVLEEQLASQNHGAQPHTQQRLLRRDDARAGI
ncbi:MAG: ribbon-helix-helix protein, CopG family [Candidatus Aenigmarchaeota archaeon]|nr:ribbon-helix-helix protein, CopG family [Candidatus Aenigmarchaeota archaeon]